MKKIIVFYILLNIFFQYSCKKNNPVSDKDIQSIEDNIVADNLLQDVFVNVNSYAVNYLKSNIAKIDTSLIVTIYPRYPIDSFPKTMIINYSNGINCSDGKIRKGKIIATVYNYWQHSIEDSMQVELVNFIVDSVKINGSLVIKNTENSDSTQKFSLNISNCKFDFENGKFFQINSSKTINWISGFNTITDFLDDNFLIDGKSNGINRNQVGFEAKIISSLKYSSQCYSGKITQGIIEITPQDATKRIVDFGSGVCDNIANITINGTSFSIEF